MEAKARGKSMKAAGLTVTQTDSWRKIAVTLKMPRPGGFELYDLITSPTRLLL